MGWEKRRGRYYYYRYRRVNGRKVREYFGCGPEAEEAARQDAEARAQKMRNREALVQLEAEVAMIFAADDHMAALCAVYWMAAGYHKYRGVWRKKRKKKADANPGGAATATANVPAAPELQCG